MVNSLTREASVKLGQILLETLLRHYFDRIIKDNTAQGRVLTQLRKDELLYDETFIVVKVCVLRFASIYLCLTVLGICRCSWRLLQSESHTNGWLEKYLTDGLPNMIDIQ